MSGGRNKNNLIGERFGNLVVVKEAGSNNRGLALWECLCDCGTTYKTSGYYLRQRRKKSCGCKSNRKTGIDNPKWSGYKGISGSYWHSIRSGAKAREMEFSVTIQHVWELFEKQEGKCALTKRILQVCHSDKGIRTGEQTASLDRIDSSKGYVEGNLQWIHKELQPMKMSKNQQRFIDICKEVALAHKDDNG